MGTEESSQPESAGERGRIAVDEAFVEHAASLRRYIVGKVGQAVLAEDLTSMVFLKALRWLRTERSSESVKGWLYATARTTIADYWRAQGDLDVLPLDRAEEVAIGGEADEEEARQAQTQVRRLLSLLPDRERTVLTLRYLRGYTAAEIGRRLGLSAEYVRVVQFRALRQAARAEQGERGSGMDAGEVSSTERTRQVLAFAQEEARSFNHGYVGTEHLLLRQESGTAAGILTGRQVSLERIRGGVLMFIGRGQEASDGELALTPRARTALRLGGEEAQRLGSAGTEPEHVLVGLLREGEGVAAVMLETLGVQLAAVRAVLQPRADPFEAWSCSFCGKGRDSVGHLIQGPGWVSRTMEGALKQPLLICDECVALSSTLIAEGEAKRKTMSDTTKAKVIGAIVEARDRGISTEEG